MKKIMIKLTNIVKIKKIDWFASAWDTNSLDFLDKYKAKT